MPLTYFRSSTPNRRFLRAVGTAVAAAGLAVALVACSAGPATPVKDSPKDSGAAADPLAELYEEAKAEGTLTWYTSFVPENIEQIKPAFEAQYPGVSLQVLRLGGTEGPIRFSAEAEAGANTADVLTTSEQGFAGEALTKGWTVDLADADIPTIADYPEDFVRGAEIVSAVGPIQVTFNSELVEDKPTSWEDFLESDYSDQLMLVDPRAILPWMAQYSLLLDTYGPEYLEGLADNDYRLVESAVPGAQGLAAGESFALFPSLASVSNPLIKEGAPVENVTLAPFTGVENSSLINAKAPHPAAARLFVGWIATAEGQEAINSNFGASPLENIPGATPLGDGYVRYDRDEVNANRAEVLKALGIE